MTLEPNNIYCGDCLELLKKLPDNYIQCCITSPPYWSLRNYGVEDRIWGGSESCSHEWGDRLYGDTRERNQDSSRWAHNPKPNDEPPKHIKVSQGTICVKCGAWKGSLGLEPTPQMYIEHMLMIFREVNRVLRSDGILWLVLGDTYAHASIPGGGDPTTGTRNVGSSNYKQTLSPGLKPKDLVAIPWRTALMLQADGWWLRQGIPWYKRNPMPESVKDRCTNAHEYVFLMAKSARYYFDNEAIKEQSITPVDSKASHMFGAVNAKYNSGEYAHTNNVGKRWEYSKKRNKHSVWIYNTEPFNGAHFATMPTKLVEPMILAGTREGDIVLDPFVGSGTVTKMAARMRRQFIGFDLNPEYCEMSENRTFPEIDQLKMAL